MKNRTRAGAALLITGLLLIAAALFLVIRNLNDERLAGEKSRQTVDYLLQELETVGQDADGEPVTAIETPDGRYIGILTIPRLSLELPVLGELSSAGLKIAPCRYSGGAESNDLVIAAHNYSTHFGELYRLAIGDEVYFTCADGTVIRYEVAESETLKPYETERMTESDFDLTLFTCTVGGRSRVTVRCERADA